MLPNVRHVMGLVSLRGITRWVNQSGTIDPTRASAGQPIKFFRKHDVVWLHFESTILIGASLRVAASATCIIIAQSIVIMPAQFRHLPTPQQMA